MSETKICAQCGQEKPIEDFSKSYKNLCKECVAGIERERRRKLKESMMRGAVMLTDGNQDAQFIPSPRLTIATAAMQGLLSNSTWMSNLAKGYDREYDNDVDATKALIHEVASSSVEFADALLTELSKPKDELEKH